MWRLVLILLFVKVWRFSCFITHSGYNTIFHTSKLCGILRFLKFDSRYRCINFIIHFPIELLSFKLIHQLFLDFACQRRKKGCLRANLNKICRSCLVEGPLISKCHLRTMHRPMSDHFQPPFLSIQSRLHWKCKSTTVLIHPWSVLPTWRLLCQPSS